MHFFCKYRKRTPSPCKTKAKRDDETRTINIAGNETNDNGDEKKIENRKGRPRGLLHLATPHKDAREKGHQNAGARNHAEHPRMVAYPARVAGNAVQVHAEHTENEGGDGDDHRDEGEDLHDVVHIVVDDRTVRLHRGRQNIAEGVTGVQGLQGLDADILDEVLIFLVLGKVGIALDKFVDNVDIGAK